MQASTRSRNKPMRQWRISVLSNFSRSRRNGCQCRPGGTGTALEFPDSGLAGHHPPAVIAKPVFSPNTALSAGALSRRTRVGCWAMRSDAVHSRRLTHKGGQGQGVGSKHVAFQCGPRWGSLVLAGLGVGVQKSTLWRRAMKIIASSLLVLGLLAVQVSEANAVVCARGVYRAGCAGPHGAAVAHRPVGYGGAAVVRRPYGYGGAAVVRRPVRVY